MPGVFEAAGDFGVQEKAGAAVGVVGEAFVDFLEGDFAVQFLIQGDRDLAQGTRGVGAEDTEAVAARRSRCGAGVRRRQVVHRAGVGERVRAFLRAGVGGAVHRVRLPIARRDQVNGFAAGAFRGIAVFRRREAQLRDDGAGPRVQLVHRCFTRGTIFEVRGDRFTRIAEAGDKVRKLFTAGTAELRHRQALHKRVGHVDFATLRVRLCSLSVYTGGAPRANCFYFGAIIFQTKSCYNNVASCSGCGGGKL
jgi:hypothetical protein